MKFIEEKIEEIRKQPEHIRVKYVWGGVAVSMFFILIIWFFSISTMFKAGSSEMQPGNINDLKLQLQNVNQQAPSIKDIGQQITDIKNEGVKKEQNADTEFEYPIQSQQGEDEIPQSAAYSSEN